MKTSTELKLNRAKVIFGRSIRKLRPRLFFARWAFTLSTFVAGAAVVALLTYAVYDSVITTQIKDHQVQESSLKGQLAEFLLSTREPDGLSLLENPKDFGPATRSAAVVTLRRPFFGYFLKRSNAREFGTTEINWEAPRPCVVEFTPVQSPPTPFSLQACFAALPGDTMGSYVYFSLRYPTNRIRRHTLGRSIDDADRVVLTIAGSQETQLSLVFGTPPLAKGRYPSQLKRFDFVHEVTAYFANESGRASRLVNAQAFERRALSSSGTMQSFVTILGRIDSSALRVSADSRVWPTPAVLEMQIGIEIFQISPETGKAWSAFKSNPGSQGVALASLEQAYVRTVPSRAILKVVSTSPVAGNAAVVWDSSRSEIEKLPRRTGLWQQISDWWAEKLISQLGYDVKSVQAQQHPVIAGLPPLSVTLTADGVRLPDIAARALIWLSLALGAVAILGIFWLKAIRRLQKITFTAYAMTIEPTSGNSLVGYEGKQDEIATLARVLDLLIRRSRIRSANVIKRARKEEMTRLEQVRLANEHVLARKAIHSAIGHEIRSPLQSLLNKTTDQPELHAGLERMNRAVEALFDASTVEEGIKNSYVVVKPLDLSQYLSRLVTNLSSPENPIIYAGPSDGLTATFDKIVLGQILESLLENAQRYRTPGTPISIELTHSELIASISVCNEGQPIPFSDIDSIFTFGVSDSQSLDHIGLGLFAARSRSLAMRGTIRAENRTNGVAFVITLPRGPARS